MSLLQVELIDEIFTPAQKEEIMDKLTDAMVSIEQENKCSAAWFSMEEICNGEWRIG